MNKMIRVTVGLAAICCFLTVQSSLGVAAEPVKSPTAVIQAETGNSVHSIRYSSAIEKVRIVLDVSSLPDYSVDLSADKTQITVTLPKLVNRSGLSGLTIKDPIVKSLTVQSDDNQVKLNIALKNTANYKIFTLKNPNRVVIDIIKDYVESEVSPGMKYITWHRKYDFGPVAIYAVNVDLNAGYQLKPVLSNEKIYGLDTVKSMANQVNAIAAVNGSYFSATGEILGILKMDNTIVSTSFVPRSGVGIMPGGRLVFDQVDYQGMVRLADKRVIGISGVNCERGNDDLILYNSYYGASTRSNTFGKDYVIKDGKVAAIFPSDAPIEEGTVVLSAHGKAAEVLAALKIGSSVTITQSLGQKWDDALFVLGCGPMLMKDGNIFLTTKAEKFGPDVAAGRAPRTAIGVTKEGRLLLVVVDGRSDTSVGLSLLELAQLMQKLGAVDALNLDGGGSSEMVLKNNIVNHPSDNKERLVGDALVVVPSTIAK